MVICRLSSKAPETGDIVAAEINKALAVEIGWPLAAEIGGDEAEITVLVRYERVDGDIFLMPQNPAWPPIGLNRASISGRVVVVLRRV